MTENEETDEAAKATVVAVTIDSLVMMLIAIGDYVTGVCVSSAPTTTYDHGQCVLVRTWSLCLFLLYVIMCFSEYMYTYSTVFVPIFMIDSLKSERLFRGWNVTMSSGLTTTHHAHFLFNKQITQTLKSSQPCSPSTQPPTPSPLPSSLWRVQNCRLRTFWIGVVTQWTSLGASNCFISNPVNSSLTMCPSPWFISFSPSSQPSTSSMHCCNIAACITPTGSFALGRGLLR